MITKAFAEHFAAEWIAAWNSHDLSRILSHYSDDFEMSSPVIVQITGEASGKLKGKTTVSAYWQKALTKMPNLHFDLISVLIGVDTVTLYYKGHRGLSAEVFHFNAAGRITEAFAHYVEPPM
jgi:ketosteroid isomerase-like protein